MPDNAPPSPRSNPVVFTSLITAALAAAVLSGAAFSGAASSAAQDLLRTAGFERSGEVLAEQRRQADTLERIELAVGRVRADIALLNARIDEVEIPDLDAAATAPANPGPGSASVTRTSSAQPAAVFTQSRPPQSGPQFDLGALRTSLDAESGPIRTGFARRPQAAGPGWSRKTGRRSGSGEPGAAGVPPAPAWAGKGGQGV